MNSDVILKHWHYQLIPLLLAIYSIFGSAGIAWRGKMPTLQWPITPKWHLRNNHEIIDGFDARRLHLHEDQTLYWTHRPNYYTVHYIIHAGVSVSGVRTMRTPPSICRGDDSKPRWSGAGNTQFTLPARHDKTVLSVSCPAVWIESRDRLATSEQLVDKSPCLGQPHSSWWWCHDVGYPLLDAEHSLCMVWNSLLDDLRAQQDMSPLDRAWKPSFSLDTSVFSALETLW